MGQIIAAIRNHMKSHSVTVMSLIKHQDILTKHHTRIPESPSKPDYEQLYKYMRLASTLNKDVEEPQSCLGLTMPLFLSIITSDQYRFATDCVSHTTKNLFMRMLRLIEPLGFTIDDIVHINMPETKNITIEPFYIIIRDGSKYIVIIRGTTTPGDFLADDEYINIEIDHDGQIFQLHGGFYKCAQAIMAQLDKLDIRDATFTGISMGAGISSVISILLNIAGQHATAWTFAQPPCVSANAAEYGKGFIQSYHVENDNIARLSGAAVRNFCWRAQQLNEGKDVANMTTGTIQELLKEDGDVYGAGNIFVMYSDEFYEIAKEDLVELIPAPVQAFDHFVANYILANCEEQFKRRLK